MYGKKFLSWVFDPCLLISQGSYQHFHLITLLCPNIKSHYSSNQFPHISHHQYSAPYLSPLYFIISHHIFLIYKYSQVICLFKKSLDPSGLSPNFPIWATGSFLIGALHCNISPPTNYCTLAIPKSFGCHAASLFCTWEGAFSPYTKNRWVSWFPWELRLEHREVYEIDFQTIKELREILQNNERKDRIACGEENCGGKGLKHKLLLIRR